MLVGIDSRVLVDACCSAFEYGAGLDVPGTSAALFERTLGVPSSPIPELACLRAPTVC
jgi:hypothetical protein